MYFMNGEKRKVAGTDYEVSQQFQIGGKRILLTENLNADDGLFYLVCDYQDNGIVGEYSRAVAGDDYLDALQEFTGRIRAETEKIRAERDARGFPRELFTAEHCLNDYNKSIAGKVVALKASALAPEWRDGSNQLVLAVHGAGVMADPHGNAVYCYHLSDGKHTRCERYDVLGMVKVLPEWAKERLAAMLAEREAKGKPAPETNAGYTITEQIRVGDTRFVLGERPDGSCVTWQQCKGREGFDVGHYFEDRAKAVTDLHTRADRARDALKNRTRQPKRRDDAR
jgi:hypothetical protein